MAKKSILGTPLGSLLSTSIIEEPEQNFSSEEMSATAVTAAPKNKNHQVISYIPVDRLERSPYQPRKEFDEDALNELADSIRAQGILQPIVVRAVGVEKRFEIIAGERRWRAAQLAGLEEVPAIVREVSDETALALAIVENLQREDLSPLEEAMGLERLMNEFQMSHQEMGDVVGKSRASVSNLLRLLTLRSEVKTMLEHNDLEMGHARALLSLQGMQQVEAARVVVAKSLSVRQTEAYVRHLMEQKESAFQAKQGDPDIIALEQRLSETLGANVNIQHTAKGKGKLVVKYSSLDELEGILAHIT